MSARTAADRAAIWLGVASLASLIFLVLKRELHFVLIPKPGIAVAVVLGLLAMLGGWLSNRVLVLVAAIGFLAAAVAQVVLQTQGASLAANSNGSTLGLWLGLGFGLLAIGLTRPQP
jgi:hypothetical protein